MGEPRSRYAGLYKWELAGPSDRGRFAHIDRLTEYGLKPILWNAVATVIDGDFEWDVDKAASNLARHGVSFPEAATVFADPAAVYLDDGSGTDRMVVIGSSIRDRTLFVVHVERGARDRIISARPATRPERDVYESGEPS